MPMRNLDDYVAGPAQYNTALAQATSTRLQQQHLLQQAAQDLARQEFQKQQYFGNEAVRGADGRIDPIMSQKAMELAQARQTMGAMEGLGIGGTVAPTDEDIASNDYRKGLMLAKERTLPLEVRRDVVQTQTQGRENVANIQADAAKERAQLAAETHIAVAEAKKEGKDVSYINDPTTGEPIPGLIMVGGQVRSVRVKDEPRPLIDPKTGEPVPDMALVGNHPVSTKRKVSMSDVVAEMLQGAGKTNAPAAKPAPTPTANPPAGTPKVQLNPKGDLKINGYRIIERPAQ